MAGSLDCCLSALLLTGLYVPSAYLCDDERRYSLFLPNMNSMLYSRIKHTVHT